MKTPFDRVPVMSVGGCLCVGDNAVGGEGGGGHCVIFNQHTCIALLASYLSLVRMNLKS